MKRNDNFYQKKYQPRITKLYRPHKKKIALSRDPNTTHHFRYFYRSPQPDESYKKLNPLLGTISSSHIKLSGSKIENFMETNE